jgi:cell division septation protein DedD
VLFRSAEQRQRGLQLAAELAKQDRASAVASVLAPATAEKPKPPKTPPKPRTEPTPTTTLPTPPKPAPAKPVVAPAALAKPTTGPWRIQLGAFSTPARAQTQWKTISAKVGALTGLQRYLETEGAVTRLQAGPFANQDQAAAACRAVKATGGDCLVKNTP